MAVPQSRTKNSMKPQQASLSTKPTVYEKRGYAVVNVRQARRIANRYLAQEDLEEGASMALGLPELDDRYHIWRVPLTASGSNRLGEVVVDARTSMIQPQRTTATDILKSRLNKSDGKFSRGKRSGNSAITRSKLGNTIVLGKSEQTLSGFPAESVDLVFTSPPYFNAKPDYAEYPVYEDYLSAIRRVVDQCHRLLAQGRFFVINVAPVLLRRSSRSQASRRIAVPFDLHPLIVDAGFDFVDDIIWEKPAGAGWATGRGRRFAADRNPLQYKAVPVTEYVLVYRKKTDRLIDWNIRNHPDRQAVEDSRIGDDYERTNIWRIPPTSSAHHPAVFPKELVDRVVKYYSFKGDVVLDPFAGIGTVGESCVANQRRFILSEMCEDYVDVIKKRAVEWLNREAEAVDCINTPAIRVRALV